MTTTRRFLAILTLLLLPVSAFAQGEIRKPAERPVDMACSDSTAPTRTAGAGMLLTCLDGTIYSGNGSTWTKAGSGGGSGVGSASPTEFLFANGSSVDGIPGSSWDGTNFFPPNLAATGQGTLDFYSSIPDDWADGSALTPVDSGVAGNPNGTYSYCFVIKRNTGSGGSESWSGGTACGTPTPDVTVSSKKITVQLPYSCDWNSSEVTDIYRTAAGGSVYKLVSENEYMCGARFTDNLADGSLGVTAPTTNTSRRLSWSLANGALSVAQGDGYDVPYLNLGLPADAATYGPSASGGHGFGLLAAGASVANGSGLGLFIMGGRSAGTGGAGDVDIEGGPTQGGAGGRQAGDLYLRGGRLWGNGFENLDGFGGGVFVQGARSNGVGQTGGRISLEAGAGRVGANGGNISLAAGVVSGGGTGGEITAVSTSVPNSATKLPLCIANGIIYVGTNIAGTVACP